MINHAIGATGVVSQECKAVVEQYGQTIMDLLLSEVVTIYLCFSCNFPKVHVVYYNLIFLLNNMSTGTTPEDMLPDWVMCLRWSSWC